MRKRCSSVAIAAGEGREGVESDSTSHASAGGLVASRVSRKEPNGAMASGSRHASASSMSVSIGLNSGAAGLASAGQIGLNWWDMDTIMAGWGTEES